MKLSLLAGLAFLLAIASPAIAQIGGVGGAAGISSGGTGGSMSAPAGSLNTGPQSVAPSTTGNTVNPGGQITPNAPATQQQQQTNTIPSYVNPSQPNTTAPGLAPVNAP